MSVNLVQQYYQLNVTELGSLIAKINWTSFVIISKDKSLKFFLWQGYFLINFLYNYRPLVYYNDNIISHALYMYLIRIPTFKLLQRVPSHKGEGNQQTNPAYQKGKLMMYVIQRNGPLRSGTFGKKWG